jgi:LPS-assembly protein
MARLLAGLLIAVCTALLALPAWSQAKGPPDIPFLLKADQLTVDENREIVVATGNVEISRGSQVLLADRVTYSQKTERLTASGNVALLHPTGEVTFAEQAEFSDDFKDGVAKGIRMLLTDNSRLAAVSGRRSEGLITEMKKGVYSPCKLCKGHPKRPPLWRIKAARIIHDAKNKNVEYRDATLEMFGIPVFYTPYLTHPDPSVKRRSGFLAPDYGNSSDLGVVIRAPYYINIAQDKDATITPILTTNEGPVFFGEYRQRLRNGEFEIEGSITQSNKGVGTDDDTRGHIRGRGRFDLNDVWRAGFEIDRSSDDTYLRRYDFGRGGEDTLTSLGFVEGFHGRNYAKLSAMAFQGLRERDDAEETPLVTPFGEFNYVSRPDRWGGRFDVDASFLALTRSEGTDSRRLSLKSGWRLPYTSPGGHVYTLSASLQTDIYHVENLTAPKNPTASKQSGVTGRIFPQLTMDWRYPLVRRDRKATHLIEPMAAIVISPNGHNPGKIPNDDSQDLVFDDTNLFSPNRFTGVDRVDGGQRITYGLNWGLFGHKNNLITGFIGQSFRLRDNNDFSAGSGLNEQLSDLVARVRYSPNSNINILYRTRIDPDDFSANRSEVDLGFGFLERRGWINLDYLLVSEEAGTGEFGDREEISGSLSYRINNYWRMNANARRDLSANGGFISYGGGFMYEDECFIFNTTLNRSFTRDRDIEPTDNIFFKLTFKHLGEVTL